MPQLQLYPHNQRALNSLREALRAASRAAVIQPTGTGKSFIALAFIEDHPGADFLYLSPSNYIFDQLRRHAAGADILAHTTMVTYQRLARIERDQLLSLSPAYIILDEFHRCGAEEWGAAVNALLRGCPDTTLIGFSATPIRYLDRSGVRDMAEELFRGNVAHYYSLGEAISEGILPAPQYILADIDLPRKVERRDRLLRVLHERNSLRLEADKLLQELRRSLADALGVDQIFQTYLPRRNAKLVVFCRSLEHIDKAQNSMRNWLTAVNPTIRCYACRSDDGEADRMLSAFIQDTGQDAIRLLFCVDMLNEGLHIQDVDGIVMLRPTASPTVYFQQIGRCLASSGGLGRQPVIFDLVDNYDSARIDGQEERVFQRELILACSPTDAHEPPGIPFEVTGNLTEFQTVLDKFDHLFVRRSRWEFLCSVLREYIELFGHYPRHVDRYRGICIGYWLSRQYYGLMRGSLSSEQAQALHSLPGWEGYQAERNTGWLRQQRTWTQQRDRLADFLSRSQGIYPTYRTDLSLYYWSRRNAKRYLLGSLPESCRHSLESLPQWSTFVESWDARNPGMKSRPSIHSTIPRLVQELQRYTAEHEGRNPTKQYKTQDGYALGNRVNHIRQDWKKGRLFPEEIRALEQAGIVWEHHKRKTPYSFEDYYRELLRYREQEGHIRVPQSYVVPATGCKLGVFIQRMRMAYRGHRGYVITPEQIRRLDEIGMIWDASTRPLGK